MTTTIARFNIDTEQAQKNVAEMNKQLQDTSRSVKSNFVPLLTGSFLTGLFGGSLLSAAVGAGFATESMWRLEEAMSRFSITMGGSVLQSLDNVFGVLSSLIEEFNKLPKPVKDTSIQIVVYAALLWGLLKVVGILGGGLVLLGTAIRVSGAGFAFAARWVNRFLQTGTGINLMQGWRGIIQRTGTALALLTQGLGYATSALGTFLQGKFPEAMALWREAMSKFKAGMVGVRTSIRIARIELSKIITSLRGFKIPNVLDLLNRLANRFRGVRLSIPGSIVGIRNFIKNINLTNNPVVKFITGLGRLIMRVPILGTVLGILGRTVGKLLGPIGWVLIAFDLVKNVIDNTKTNVQLLTNALNGQYTPLVKIAGIGLALVGITGPLGNILQKLVQYISAGAWRTWAYTLANYIQNPLQALLDIVNGLVGKMNDFLSLISRIPGVDLEIPEIEFGRRNFNRGGSPEYYGGNNTNIASQYGIPPQFGVGRIGASQPVFQITINANDVFGAEEIENVINRTILNTFERGGYNGVFR